METTPIIQASVPARGNVAVKWSGILGTAIAFLSALTLAVNDNSVSLAEWVAIAQATAVGAAAAFGISYASPAKQ